MKTTPLTLLTALLLVLTTSAGRAQTEDYTITCGGQGRDGQYLVKVTTRVSKKADGGQELKRCAVHGVITRGFAGDEAGCVAQKALVTDADALTEHRATLTALLSDGGGYERYVTLVSGSYSSTLLKKKKMEVEALLLVDKESLLHWLEDRGVVKGFSNFW